MAKVIVGMTMSLDGYVEDAQGTVAALYPDFATMSDSEPMRASIRDTGAVVMGRRAFEMAADPDFYAASYEYQVPIFVITHTPPERRPKETNTLSFTFVADGVERAVDLARAAAGERDVTVVGGASTVRQCLAGGLADELHVDVMPVLLGAGLRLFEGTPSLPLERLAALELPGGRTHLRFRVVRNG